MAWMIGRMECKDDREDIGCHGIGGNDACGGCGRRERGECKCECEVDPTPNERIDLRAFGQSSRALEEWQRFGRMPLTDQRIGANT